MTPPTTIGLFLLLTATAGAQTFDRLFHNRTLRVDYYHSGTKGQEFFALEQCHEEGEWAGSRHNLIDHLNRGEYQARVYDIASATLIFSCGYSTLFNEWQTTDEAAHGQWRTFHESVLLPMPKGKIQFTICRRDRQMNFREIFSCVIDPNAPTQVNRSRRVPQSRITALQQHGPADSKVDLVLLGDGYSAAEQEKFRRDARHFNDVLFATSPFKERRQDFNVWLIEVISEESGISKPGANVWKNNALGTAYDTFGSARYVLTTANKTLRDLAGQVPYDFINILVNDNRYGGGGIYRLYTTTYTISDQPGQEWQRDYVYVHEFGHSFAGLGDEYYSSQVSYNEFYAKNVEPWEPNITALLDKANLKWKAFVLPNTPLPTPWEKAEYDSLALARARLDRLAPDYYAKREPIFKRQEEILKKTQYAGKVGAFEGAGYEARGLYRPSADCRMFSLSLVDFDPVCRAAIEQVIDFYTKPAAP
ncbi:MAG: IgA Peptidase M64 [candidate division KSB1 bacterium]|nr:IgA Peptidase M64 [candidate division KSB1 bacterium]MDZ7275213.1 IgA Peptidase M64 [candidate division KSB1 bacterium]MDZ7287382.1 IgA Peptidase M64 [candidate division KSB1 bacterium]MDZ7299496.1 IgA Peptidase M64 [candidate division KSB1 bacterium]MDZ7305458.1 IgA Peptidase M64 [candidate division KSB1 bacterium]